MVVVEEPSYLTVRLPYLCSVRIIFVDGRLRFEPYLGLRPRTQATLLKMGGLGALALVSIRVGAPYAFGVALAALMAGIYDVFRLTITENVITRASLIYAQLRHTMPVPVSSNANVTSGGVPRQGTRELTAGDSGFRRPDELPRRTDPAIIKRT
jgi:hypothetical protein